jgi:dimethylargininase
LRRRALTRPVPDSIERCELTHLERVAIDPARARAQHAAYEQALGDLGYVVEPVAGAMDLPDSVFIEDTVVALDELAVIARPGVSSRHAETDAVAAALSRYRPLVRIMPPATLDGGDVLRVGRDVYVGISGRTNDEGLSQLADAIRPLGYRVHPVETRECLHLKSAATSADDGMLVVNPQWVDARVFAGLQAIEIDPGEPFAANVVRGGGAVLCAASAPRTRARLERAGLRVRTVDVSELAKAEGALTCCSVLIDT